MVIFSWPVSDCVNGIPLKCNLIVIIIITNATIDVMSELLHPCILRCVTTLTYCLSVVFRPKTLSYSSI